MVLDLFICLATQIMANHFGFEFAGSWRTSLCHWATVEQVMVILFCIVRTLTRFESFIKTHDLSDQHACVRQSLNHVTVAAKRKQLPSSRQGWREHQRGPHRVKNPYCQIYQGAPAATKVSCQRCLPSRGRFCERERSDASSSR